MAKARLLPRGRIRELYYSRRSAAALRSPASCQTKMLSERIA
jgi:hypothetical protein